MSTSTSASRPSRKSAGKSRAKPHDAYGNQRSPPHGLLFLCVPCFSSRYTPPSFIADVGYEGIDSSTPSTPRRHPQRHRRVHPPCWVETAASAALAPSAPPRRMSAPRRTPTASTSPAVAPRLRRRDSRAANNIRFTIHQFGCKETYFPAFRFFYVLLHP